MKINVASLIAGGLNLSAVCYPIKLNRFKILKNKCTVTNAQKIYKSTKYKLQCSVCTKWGCY